MFDITCHYIVSTYLEYQVAIKEARYHVSQLLATRQKGLAPQHEQSGRKGEEAAEGPCTLG